MFDSMLAGLDKMELSHNTRLMRERAAWQMAHGQLSDNVDDETWAYHEDIDTEPERASTDATNDDGLKIVAGFLEQIVSQTELVVKNVWY